MKKKKELKINFHLSNKISYTLIAILILVVIAVGVYAYGTNNPATFGHTMSEIAPPSPCSANQYLQFDGTNWKCGDPPLQSLTCPSGTIRFDAYTNSYNEDIYSGMIHGAGSDTCPGGDSLNAYTCDPSISITCRDQQIHDYYRTVTCKKVATVLCKEP